MAIHRGYAVSKLLFVTCLAAGITGCVSLEQIAPPVEAVASHASPQLSAGRDLYITKCAKCHAPEPITKYPAARWLDIIPDMAEQTKLSVEETTDVRAYVMAVLQKNADRAG